MADIHELADRMRSIRDTLKITNAMYLISSNNFQKSKRKLENAEPYYYNIQYAMLRVLRNLEEDVTVYIKKNNDEGKKKKRAFVIIGCDKGMAGDYNHEVLRNVEKFMGECESSRNFVLGELTRHTLVSHGIPVEKDFIKNVASPTQHRARLVMSKVLPLYKSGEVDEVWILYTMLDNGVAPDLIMEKLLPLERDESVWVNGMHMSDWGAGMHYESVEMLPSPEAVMDVVIPNYLTGYIYCSMLQSNCSEENSRMKAMKNACDNANDMLAELEGSYNRARQAQITQEITEIIAGATAQKK